MTSSPAYVVITPSVSLLDRKEKGRGVTSFKPGAGRPGIEFQTKRVGGGGGVLFGLKRRRRDCLGFSNTHEV